MMIRRIPGGIALEDRQRLWEAPWASLRQRVEARRDQADGYNVRERRWSCQDGRDGDGQGFRVVEPLWSRA